MKDWYIKFYISIISLLSPSCLQGQNGYTLADTLQNVHLQEVIINAIQPDIPGTRSVIGQDAIRHIQATDLSGLSQLLPGVLVRNPDLNAPAFFTIRSTTYGNETNALGTAILLDGSPINNNVNMQRIGLRNYGILYNSSAFSGLDLRNLSPATIESIEVIRGVPSARYGDLTSGAVLINSKAGVHPLAVGLRFTATEKLANIGKGMPIGDKGGSTLYLGANYAYSQRSPIMTEEAFQRIGFQAAYAKDFPTATLRINLRGYWTLDHDKRGNNMIEGEYLKYLNQGLSFSANGQWNMDKSWISSLEYQAGMTYSHQKNESNSYYSGIQRVTTFTTQAGEQAGIFLPPNYFTELTVDGKPICINGSLVANLRKNIQGHIFNHFLIGVSTNIEGNYGQGINFDPLCPPLEMLQVRTRSYQDIPSLYQYGTFVENLFSLRTGKMKTELQVGLRLTKPLAKSMCYNPSIDPRVNLRQILIEREDGSLLNHLSVRAGWGLTRKMPVLAYLYPEKSYTDITCFTYNDTENNHRLTVMNTFITDKTFNPELSLPINRKIEAGIHFRIQDIEADILWFDEHLRDGYSVSEQAESFTYRRYETLIDKGESPVLATEGIQNNGVPLSYVNRTTFAVYSRPQNGLEHKKQGVEYTVGPIRWQDLRTSLFINGSYIKVNEKKTALSTIHPAIEINGQPYPYAGIYETSASAYNRQVHQLFSTRFQLVTQIPRIGLITSLALQCVWIDRQQRSMESRYDNPVYLADKNGHRIDGDPMTDTGHQKRINPVYYIDREGNQHPFTQEMETDKRFSDLVLDVSPQTAFLTDSFRPYFLLNLRVTKEIGRHISIAFCANNLTKSNPERYSASTQQYTILNPDLYYGAEISYKF